MKIRNITKEESTKIGKNVLVHLIECETNFEGKTCGFRNSLIKGFQLCVTIEEKNLWVPLNKVFVEE